MTFDPSLWYKVRVSRMVPKDAIGRGVDFRPKETYTLKGDVAALLDTLPAGSAIASSELSTEMNPR